MTSFAFILGVFPLVIAEGAGHEMRRTLGMAVFAGMIGVTIFGLFLTPVFFYVMRSLVQRRTREPGHGQNHTAHAIPVVGSFPGRGRPFIPATAPGHRRCPRNRPVTGWRALPGDGSC